LRLDLTAARRVVPLVPEGEDGPHRLRLRLPDERPPGRALEPRREGRVERVEILGARDERLPERPVDVLAPGELDAVEAGERVLDPPRAHLEPGLAQHPAEGHHMADEGATRHFSPPRAAPPASHRGSPRDPRGTSAPTRAWIRPPPRRAP